MHFLRFITPCIYNNLLPGLIAVLANLFLKQVDSKVPVFIHFSHIIIYLVA